jgi:FAD binding domain
LLARAVQERELTDLRYGVAFRDLKQDEHGVTANVQEVATGREFPLRAAYLIACDGAGSRVRRCIEVPFDGRMRRLVLVRPDGQVAWRADEPPPDCQLLIDIVRGARGVQWGIDEDKIKRDVNPAANVEKNLPKKKKGERVLTSDAERLRPRGGSRPDRRHWRGHTSDRRQHDWGGASPRDQQRQS